MRVDNLNSADAVAQIEVVKALWLARNIATSLNPHLANPSNANLFHHSPHHRPECFTLFNFVVWHMLPCRCMNRQLSAYRGESIASGWQVPALLHHHGSMEYIPRALLNRLIFTIPSSGNSKHYFG